MEWKASKQQFSHKAPPTESRGVHPIAIHLVWAKNQHPEIHMQVIMAEPPIISST